MPRHTAAGVRLRPPRHLLDHVVQHFLDLELALGLQVGAASAAVGDDATVCVGEERHRLRAAGVDAENVHRISLSASATFAACWQACYIRVLHVAPLPSRIVCAVVCTTALTAAFQAAPEQTRALWVTRATLASPESIKQMVAAAEAGGFNTLLVQVRGRGDAYYLGTLEPRASELASRPSFDPLATVIEQAHAAGLASARVGRGQPGIELSQPAGVP